MDIDPYSFKNMELTHKDLNGVHSMLTGQSISYCKIFLLPAAIMIEFRENHFLTENSEKLIESLLGMMTITNQKAFTLVMDMLCWASELVTHFSQRSECNGECQRDIAALKKMIFETYPEYFFHKGRGRELIKYVIRNWKIRGFNLMEVTQTPASNQNDLCHAPGVFCIDGIPAEILGCMRSIIELPPEKLRCIFENYLKIVKNGGLYNIEKLYVSPRPGKYDQYYTFSEGKLIALMMTLFQMEGDIFVDIFHKSIGSSQGPTQVERILDAIPPDERSAAVCLIQFSKGLQLVNIHPKSLSGEFDRLFYRQPPAVPASAILPLLIEHINEYVFKKMSHHTEIMMYRDWLIELESKQIASYPIQRKRAIKRKKFPMTTEEKIPIGPVTTPAPLPAATGARFSIAVETSEVHPKGVPSSLGHQATPTRDIKNKRKKRGIFGGMLRRLIRAQE